MFRLILNTDEHYVVNLLADLTNRDTKTFAGWWQGALKGCAWLSPVEASHPWWDPVRIILCLPLLPLNGVHWVDRLLGYTVTPPLSTLYSLWSTSRAQYCLGKYCWPIKVGSTVLLVSPPGGPVCSAVSAGVTASLGNTNYTQGAARNLSDEK